MDYQKKYPLTGFSNDYLIIDWERGYKNVRVFHKDRLIKTVENAQQLKKGVIFTDETLGKVELKFSESPMALNVVVEELHSLANTNHPFREIKKFAWVFWVLAIFGFIFSALEISTLSLYPPIQLIVAFIDLILIGSYTVAAIFISKGKAWAFWVGAIPFVIYTFLSIIGTIFSYSGFALILVIVLRGMILVGMFLILKDVLSAHKHSKYTRNLKDLDAQLLDNLVDQ